MTLKSPVGERYQAEVFAKMQQVFGATSSFTVFRKRVTRDAGRRNAQSLNARRPAPPGTHGRYSAAVLALDSRRPPRILAKSNGRLWVAPDPPQETTMSTNTPSPEKSAPLIGACGLTCSECSAYIATQANDAEGIARTIEEWRVQHGGDFKPEDVWCDGCMTDGRAQVQSRPRRLRRARLRSESRRGELRGVR